MARNSLYLDLTNRRFGKWLVIRRGEDRHGASYWECICDCGTRSFVRGSCLRRGHSTGCKCISVSKVRKHGMTYQPEWKSWTGIKSRCYTKTDHHYKHYGARGIRVCGRWRESFLNFYADMGKCPKGFTIERVNNDGNYEPSNCIWADKRTQCRNRRNNVWLTLNGKRKIINDWSKELGLGLSTMRYRRKKGLTDEQILSKPDQKRRWGGIRVPR